MDRASLKRAGLSCINFNLRKAARAVTAIYDRSLAPVGITSTQFSIMIALAYYPEHSMSALSKFLVAVSPGSIQVAPDIEQYFGTVLTLFLIFGIAFEVPVAVVVLARLGVVSLAQLRAWRGYYVVVAAIASAIVTPPDVISQLSLLVPLILLYEVGIIAARLFIKHTQAPAEEGQPNA